MKKQLRLAISLMLSLAMCCVAASCSDDDPKPVPEPVPDVPDEPKPSEPVGHDAAITAYFNDVLEGNEAQLPDLTEMTMDDADAMASHVWDLYAEAVKAKETALPTPFDLVAKWNAYEYAYSGTMKLTNGEDMQYAYAYKGSRPSSGWPMFISLHGSGDDSGAEFQATFDWDAYYSDSPCVYFIPQSPKGGTGCRWFQPSRQNAWERLLRAAYVGGTVDPNKIYFMGISEGAYGSQRLSGYYADYLAGVGPIAGGEPLYNFAAENSANIFYCARTGEYDTMYGRYRCTVKAQQLWDKLEQDHPGYYKHYIHIMPGVDHGLTDYDNGIYGYDGITAKLKEYSRNPYPKYVYWQNYPLGNINGESYECRKAFYNIRPLEAQNGKTDGNVHDAYEMTIDGNTVTLNVYSVTVTPKEEVSEDGWTMNVDCEKTSVPATSGKIRLYLNKELVDLSAPVTVVVNGKTAFTGDVKPSADVMVESAALFFDPARVVPASVDVEVK